jgi:O-antigen ligase
MYSKTPTKVGVFVYLNLLYNKIMNSIIKKVILATVFVLPFVFFSQSRFPAVFPKSLFIELVTLIIGVLWVIGFLYNKRREGNNVSWNIATLSFSIYILILILSCFHSIVPQLSFWGSLDRGVGIIFMLHIFLFSLITASVFKTKEDWNKLFVAFILSEIFFTIGTFMSEAGIKFSSLFKLEAAKGFTFGNSSFAGIYLAFVFFISLGILLSSDKKYRKIIGILGIITVIINPIITGFATLGGGLIGQARASFASIILGLVVFSLYLIFRKIKSSKGVKIFITALSLILISGAVFLYSSHFSFKQFMVDNGASNRLVFWGIAVKGFKEKPLLGWGNDNYRLVYGKYFDPIITKNPDYSPEYWVDRSHSIYFDELVSNGILGFISLMFLYGVLLFGFLRKAIREKDNKTGMLFMSIFVGIISFLIQGVMLFQVVIGWFIIAILIAFVSVFCFDNQNSYLGKINIEIFRKYKLPISILSVVVFCFGFVYLFVLPLSSAMNLTKMLNTSQENRLKIYKEIDNTYIGNTADLGDVFLEFFKGVRMGVAKSDLSPAVLEAVKNEIQDINNILDHASSKEKYMDVKILMTQVEFSSLLTILSEGTGEQKDYYDKGMEYVKKMSEISPQNPLVKNAQGMMKFAIQ